MTVYQKYLKEILSENCSDCSLNVIIDTLFRIGIIDYTQCKALCLRDWVEQKEKQGLGRIDAMWMATEVFACSYEYVRKCIYYYKDLCLN